MTFKKTAVLALTISLFSSVQALPTKSVEILNSIMDKGVIVNKKIATDNDKVDLVIYKGLVTSNAAYALVKITNNGKEVVDVASVVKDGTPIKDELMKDESTYVIVEEKKIENTVKKDVLEKVKKNNIDILVKSSNFKEVAKSVDSIYNVFFINKDDEIVQIPKYKLKEYFDTIEFFDYYEYIDLDIQKGLYRGVFANGYETLSNGKITPKTYYFVIDNFSGKINYLYVVNKKVNYNQLANLVKGKK